MPLATPSIDVHMDADDLHRQLAYDARVGLSAPSKWLPATWFYDEVGCGLFEDITRLPEYYPTRTERSILDAHADDIARLARPHTLIELGSGTSEKTALLIAAMESEGSLQRFVPFDVAGPTLREAMVWLGEVHPELQLHGVVGDFRQHLPQLLAAVDGPPRTVVFLGGTIGNLNPVERRVFLSTLHEHMNPADTLLIGTDRVKAADRLVAAYDDAAGVTAAFNLNVLTVLGRELGGAVDVDAFEHLAVWSPEARRIEMRLRAKRAVAFHLDEIDLDVTFEAGEEMLTEISSKFTPRQIEDELAGGGFDVAEAWTDPDEDFQLTLARPAA